MYNGPGGSEVDLAPVLYNLVLEVESGWLARKSWPDSIPSFMRYIIWPRFTGQILYLKNLEKSRIPIWRVRFRNPYLPYILV